MPVSPKLASKAVLAKPPYSTAQAKLTFSGLFERVITVRVDKITNSIKRTRVGKTKVKR